MRNSENIGHIVLRTNRVINNAYIDKQIKKSRLRNNFLNRKSDTDRKV